MKRYDTLAPRRVFINSQVDYSDQALQTMCRLLDLQPEQLPIFTIGFCALRGRELYFDGQNTTVRG